MKQKFFNLQINTDGQKLYEFTNQTIKWIQENQFKNGILNLSILHTSASLIIQENARLICVYIPFLSLRYLFLSIL